MNSNYGKSNSKPGSSNHFDFDLGLNSSRSRPLNEQKNPTSSYSSASSYSSYASRPNKPAWTHQPAAQSQPARPGSLSGPTSMVGDIFGKSWTSSTPANATNNSAGIGIAKKDPNLFGDLLSSALGQNKGSANVPLKNAAPVGNRGAFSMGSMTDSLPNNGGSMKGGGNWGSSESFGSYSVGSGVGSGLGGNVNFSGNVSKSSNLGSQPMKGMSGNGVGGAMGVNKDPFGSLVDFGSKPSGSGASVKPGSGGSSKSSNANDAFRDFQEAPKTNSSKFSSSSFSAGNSSSMGSTAGGSYSNVDDFVFSGSQPQSQPSVHTSGVNEFDALFSSTSEPVKGSVVDQFPGGDDWGMMDSMSGGGNESGGTTELEGLPPPPAGVSASSAKDKGLEYYKQGQYADAIKWLSWAVILFEKVGEDDGTIKVLSCRASCYKEIGENKKAVADCSKVLEKDGTNISVLVQRALLYESMEKYKLGAEDLRTVMKYDPGNRVAKSTIHRLTKMAG